MTTWNGDHLWDQTANSNKSSRYDGRIEELNKFKELASQYHCQLQEKEVELRAFKEQVSEVVDRFSKQWASSQLTTKNWTDLLQFIIKADSGVSAPAAYMYTYKDGKTRQFSSKLHDLSHPLWEGWTETALYTADAIAAGHARPVQADLVEALELAADRLYWASRATPGAGSKGGKELLAGWCQDARAAITRATGDGA